MAKSWVDCINGELPAAFLILLCLSWHVCLQSPYCRTSHKLQAAQDMAERGWGWGLGKGWMQ